MRALVRPIAVFARLFWYGLASAYRFLRQLTAALLYALAPAWVASEVFSRVAQTDQAVVQITVFAIMGVILAMYAFLMATSDGQRRAYQLLLGVAEEMAEFGERRGSLGRWLDPLNISSLFDEFYKGWKREIPFFNLVQFITVGATFFGALVFALAKADVFTLSSGGYEPRDVMLLFLWEFLDSIPVLEVPETLNWDQPVGYKSMVVGALVLTYKVAMALPVVAAFRVFWILRGQTRKAESGSPEP